MKVSYDLCYINAVIHFNGLVYVWETTPLEELQPSSSILKFDFNFYEGDFRKSGHPLTPFSDTQATRKGEFWKKEFVMMWYRSGTSFKGNNRWCQIGTTSGSQLNMIKQISISEQKIHNAIIFLRGKRTIIDSDLAEFYGATTKQLNQAIKRNPDRFPDDFMFQLTEKEKEYVVTNCDHLSKLKFSPYLPHAFTEHGAVMAANVLNSPVAVHASIQVVRVFIRISEVLIAHKEIADKIAKLQRKLGGRLDKHDKEINVLFEAIRRLMQPSNPPRKKIGFKISKQK